MKEGPMVSVNTKKSGVLHVLLSATGSRPTKINQGPSSTRRRIDLIGH